MHFPTALSSLLVAAAGLTAASPVEPLEAFTAPRVSAATVQKAGGFKDMILSEIRTNTLGASANATAPNRQISCMLPQFLSVSNRALIASIDLPGNQLAFPDPN